MSEELWWNRKRYGKLSFEMNALSHVSLFTPTVEKTVALYDGIQSGELLLLIKTIFDDEVIPVGFVHNDSIIPISALTSNPHTYDGQRLEIVFDNVGSDADGDDASRTSDGEASDIEAEGNPVTSSSESASSSFAYPFDYDLTFITGESSQYNATGTPHLQDYIFMSQCLQFVDLESLIVQFQDLSSLESMQSFGQAMASLIQETGGLAGLPADSPDRICSIAGMWFHLFYDDDEDMLNLPGLMSGISTLCKGEKDDKIIKAFGLFDDDSGKIVILDENAWVVSVFSRLLKPSLSTCLCVICG